MVGKPLTPLQWTQAKLPTKAGDLGLLSPRLELGLDIVHLADLSFLASLRKCRAGIQALFPTFPYPQLQHLETTAIQHLALGSTANHRLSTRSNHLLSKSYQEFGPQLFNTKIPGIFAILHNENSRNFLDKKRQEVALFVKIPGILCQEKANSREF